MKTYMKARIISSMTLMAIGVCVPIQSNIPTGTLLHNASKKSISATASANWAGYAASGTGFTSLQANWEIPTIKPSSTFGVDATWIGIGGVTSDDLIQGGTEAIVDHGTVKYVAWTEALPAASQPLSLVVHAGDTITASVMEDQPGHWSVIIGDNTTGKSDGMAYQYNSSHSSAEWIEEAPSDASGVLPIDNFGSVTFSNATANKNGSQLSIAQLGGTAITMAAEDGTILAKPSALSKTGQVFSVSRSSGKATVALHRIFGSMETWTHKNHGIKKRNVHE